MLTDDEHCYVIKCVTNHLTVGNPIALLSAVLPTECMNKIDHALGYPESYARSAIQVCQADRWNNEPCWLWRLLEIIPTEAESDRIRERIAKPPPFEEHEENRVLCSEAPFFDRETLRPLTRSLRADRTPRPILIINGERESGKSYTYEYVDHLRLAGKLSFTPFRVEFHAESGMLFGPRELSTDILTSMGVSVNRLAPGFFDADTNGERWPFNLAGKILSEGAALKDRFWIVLDNFRGPTLLPATAKLIDGLAQWIISSTVYADRFRLVLIHYDHSALSIQPHRVARDETAGILAIHVRECVTEIYERYFPSASKQLRVKSLARMMDGLPEKGRLKELNARLIDLMESLKDARHA